MNRIVLNSLEFVLCWFLLLTQPFFPGASGFSLLSNCLIVIITFFSLNQLLNSKFLNNQVIKYSLLGFTFGGFILSFLALILEKPFLYSIWSRFGAGSMSLDGQLYIFGDLAHLTSASKCSKPIFVGTNACDPWERKFNQNPQIIEFFRFATLTNVRARGFVSVVIFFLILLVLLKKLRISSITTFLMVSTPVIILSIDRGNEIITLSLILLGMLMLETKLAIRQAVFGSALVLAAIFKLWPIVLIFFISVFYWKKMKLTTKVILSLPFLYWAVRVDEIRAMLEATQQGSSSGLSFGLKLLAFNDVSVIYRVTLFTIAISFFLLLKKFTKMHLELFITDTQGLSVLRSISPYMITYAIIWMIGDSFIYRMVILLPIVILLSNAQVSQFIWPKLIQSAIIVTCISGNTPAILVTSSVIALYFIFVSITIQKRIRGALQISN